METLEARPLYRGDFTEMPTRTFNSREVPNGYHSTNIHKIQDKLEVEEVGRSGLKLRSVEQPHLVSLGGRRVSTAITLLSLNPGVTTVGSAKGQDVLIHGESIKEKHCLIENKASVVTLYPVNESMVSIDGVQINQPVVLTQGSMICLGKSRYFRFNHPEQAIQLENSTIHEVEQTATLDKSHSSPQDKLAGNETIIGTQKGRSAEHQSIDSESGSKFFTHSQSPFTDSELPDTKYADDLAESSFRNKLRRFEDLSSPTSPGEMAPPTNHRFPFHNFIGEKLFTRDTNTTRLSLTESDGKDSPSHSVIKSPPEIKPKPVPGFGKSKPRLDVTDKPPVSPGERPIVPPADHRRLEFKTLSMISTETSIWGSTSSAGTVLHDGDEGSVTTPGYEDTTPGEDVFSQLELEDDTATLRNAAVPNPAMSDSYSQKHQQMIEERKLEEAMERKEQERLEEILMMCAQYERQIDSEIEISNMASGTDSSLSPTGTGSSTVSFHSVSSRYDKPISLPSDTGVDSIVSWAKSTQVGYDRPTEISKGRQLQTKPADIITYTHKGLNSTQFNHQPLTIQTQNKMERSYHDKMLDASPLQSPTSAEALNVSSHSSSNAHSMDRRRIKTNGSLIQSPTHSNPPTTLYTSLNNSKASPAHRNQTPTHNSKPAPPEHLTPPSSLQQAPLQAPPSTSMLTNHYYEDDSRVYDCPANFMQSDDTSASNGINPVMLTSVYADDNRIYDSPADVMELPGPPPIPPHSNRTSSESGASRPSYGSGGSGEQVVLPRTPSKQPSYIRQDPGSSARQDPGSSARQDPGSSARQDPGSSARQDPGSSARQDPGSSARQDSGSSARQDPGSSARQDPGSSARQDPGSSARQDSGSSARQDSGGYIRQASDYVRQDSTQSNRSAASPTSNRSAGPSPAHSKQTDQRELVEQLRKARGDLLKKLTQLRQQIEDMEQQQNEAVKELELEQALLQGEQQTELELLQTEWHRSDHLKSQKISSMSNQARQHQERLNAIESARQAVADCEARRIEIENRLRTANDDEKDDLLTQYEEAMDELDNKKKTFEDLEFQQLELEAKYEEEAESVQSDLTGKQEDLVAKIRKAELKLAQMTQQQTDMMLQTKAEINEMETKRKILVHEFNREKENMVDIDRRIRDARVHSDNMTSSQVFQYHPVDEQLLSSPSATLNKDLLSRMRTGNSIMEDEIRRLEILKHAAAEASMSQWHEPRALENNIRRFGTLDSEDEESNSVRSSETPSDGDKISYNSSTDDADRFNELQALLAQARQHVLNADNGDLARERQLRVNLEKQLAEEKERRAELVSQEVKLREKGSNVGLERPLTRYLPVRKEEFDLRNHIESTGHNLSTCPFVDLSANTCKGYLLKMGSKMKSWNKRWFVFDRTKKALLYYMDKSENKPRGGIYFQTIEDVFVDHLRTVKSPNSKFTFCVKTYDKAYYLIAKSPEALSIWIDVIFTGAEGYQEF